MGAQTSSNLKARALTSFGASKATVAKSASPGQSAPPATPSQFTVIISYLGGSKVFKHDLVDRFAVHKFLSQGLPRRALTTFVSNVHFDVDLTLNVLGTSRRTLQRYAESENALLDVESSGRLWKFAEIVAKAKEVFGSQEEGERWLATPAIALNGERPLDLLTTPAGREEVEQLLERVAYGVYT